MSRPIHRLARDLSVHPAFIETSSGKCFLADVHMRRNPESNKDLLAPSCSGDLTQQLIDG